MGNENEKMIAEFSAKVTELKNKALEKENLKLKDRIKELESELEKITGISKNPELKVEIDKPEISQVDENYSSNLIDETLNRVIGSKRFKLDDKTNSIELVVSFKGGKNLRQRQIIVSKCNEQSNEILSSKEFDCDTYEDLDIIKVHLKELNAEKQTTRCINWIINKLYKL